MKKLLFSFVIMTCSMTAVCCTSTNSDNSPKGLTDYFMKGWMQCNFETLWEIMRDYWFYNDPNDRQQYVNVPQSEYEKTKKDFLNNFGPKQKSDGWIVSYRIVDEKIEGDTASVKIMCKTRNGKEAPETFKFKKDKDGVWKFTSNYFLAS